MLMKKELLINQSRVGRWLTVVLALLLMPAGMWAEDYNLWVAGVHVTSVLLGSGESGV